ncbi:MAG: sugar nucleotide-binding protein [Flavobacteriaceae bacterium]|nr:sugar nucleotide-binding protein [Flavobacteriaceae bacterium]
MKQKKSKERILILGASGFLGHAIYTELCSYFNTFGTYCTDNKSLEKNQHFFQYKLEEDDIFEIIESIKPSLIISALRGDFSAQVIAHHHIAEYALKHNSKIIFLSSSNVFDAYSKFPSYESDKTYSNSIYGHFKIKIENLFLRLPINSAILRLPMVFGPHSTRMTELKELLKQKEPIEIFPNLIMNVTTDSRVTQQIHYIINRKRTGIFHLGSLDLVHHDDFIEDIINKMHFDKPIYKRVYTSNDERYLAVLPKYNLLPKYLQITSEQVIDSSLL